VKEMKNMKAMNVKDMIVKDLIVKDMDVKDMKEEVAALRGVSETWKPERVLAWAFDTFGDAVAISSAFGVEGMVLIDMASRLRQSFRLFTVDTEFLFPETYNLMDQVEQRYGVTIERVYALNSPDEQERLHGLALWQRNPDLCCQLRKVEPLQRKLGELQAWITSIRRDQTAARASAGKVEWDSKFGLVKINPIADWNSKQVWQYIRTHDVPYNALHERNYPSIGCTHCTRAVRPGEDARAGRWSGTSKTECGLHIIQPIVNPPEAGA
jgi:phosphoadenosine phosphosulfate reductase